MLIEDPQGGVGKLDADGLASVAEADLDALAGDLDAAATGHFSLDGAAGLRPYPVVPALNEPFPGLLLQPPPEIRAG